jgi:hypothetical protein
VVYLVRIWHAIEMNIYWGSGRIQGFTSNIIAGYTGLALKMMVLLSDWKLTWPRLLLAFYALQKWLESSH